jgi:hypothetical protein
MLPPREGPKTTPLLNSIHRWRIEVQCNFRLQLFQTGIALPVSIRKSIFNVVVSDPDQISDAHYVSEGAVDFEHDRINEHVDPGVFVYVSYGTVLKIRIRGRRPTEYFVMAIGGEADQVVHWSTFFDRDSPLPRRGNPSSCYDYSVWHT